MAGTQFRPFAFIHFQSLSTSMNKCIFLDRDGVINKDNPDYIYKVDEFEILPGVIEGLKKLKEEGYLLIVITNQSGITKGIYTTEDMVACHDYFQEVSGQLIDKFYYSPYHPFYTESLTRKPGTLMFEKALAKYSIDPSQSWMLGDKERDLEPAQKLGIKGILLSSYLSNDNWPTVHGMAQAVQLIMKN
jgi:D-glycero-D-manno-heptose 1,7-bisphosphate phosphatase